MLITYLRGALRQIVAARFYALISIGGLAVGLACTLLIVMYVRDEVSHEAWLPRADRIYRMHFDVRIPGRERIVTARSPGPLADAIREESPEVESATRMILDPVAVLVDGKPVRQKIARVDAHFFEVFELARRAGATGGLVDPASVFVTERAARTVLGPGDPVGQTITVCCFSGEQREFRVVGVLADLPRNTHLDFDLVALYDPNRYPQMARNVASWTNAAGYTYVRLRRGASIAPLRARMPAMLARRIPPLDVAGEQVEVTSMLAVEPMAVRDIYLHATRVEDDQRPVGDIRTVQALALIAVLVLLIAATNFVNLTTARSTRRAREIGVRKVVGANRRDVVVQCLVESVVTALLALVGAMVLVELTLPSFNELVGRDLPAPYQPGLLLAALLGTVVVGLLSGLYPAIVLSRFDATTAVKSSGAAAGRSGGRVRAVLVAAQFAIATGLVLCTAVVAQQTRFLVDRDPGFQTAHRHVIEELDDASVRRVSDTLLERVRAVPGVRAAALTSVSPGEGVGNNVFVDVPGQPRQLIAAMAVDYGFYETLGVTPLAGRTLSKDHAADGAGGKGGEASVLLNLAGVRRLGLGSPAEAVGKVIVLQPGDGPGVNARVVGVMPDLAFQSARIRPYPTLIYREPEAFSSMVVDLDPARTEATLAEIGAIWRSLAPAVPFATATVTSRLDEFRRDDRRFSALLAAFAVLAVLVACSGLYGLASFVTETRKKEIAIRRVMGASVLQLITLLVARLSRPVLLGSVVAIPFAYGYLERWLRQFVFRIDLSPWVVVGAAIAAVALAWLTIGVQALAVARRAPVSSLRTE